ncbi:MAG: radical SAM protein [Paludibacteraceae bacterium]|nr:radical SAM protein [Paludibacteraceae bacterium]
MIGLKKTGNILKASASYLCSALMHRPLTWGMPFFYSIEPINLCNLHCPECPSGNGSMRRKRGMISMEDYCRIIDRIAPYAVHLTLYFQGEPLLHPQFPELVRHAHARGLYTSTSTNGQLLNEEMAERLAEAGLDHLIVSVDGATQSSYETYRIGGRLDLVMDGIRHVVKAKEKLCTSKPRIEMQSLVFAHNESELEDLKRKSRSLRVDRFTLKTAQVYDYRNGSPLIPIQKNLSRYIRQADGTYRLKRSLPNRCRRMFCGAVIDWQGNVLPCSFDKDGEHAFGNLLEQDLETIWYGPRAQAFRHRLLRDRSSCTICRNCVY